MAERDPVNLNAVQEVEIDELAAAKTKAKRKKLFAALAGGIALIGGGYSAMDALERMSDETMAAHAESAA